MNPIKNPPPPAIGPNSATDAIVNLQDALLFLVERERLNLSGDERNALLNDREGRAYREGTARSVDAFRQQHQLERGEIVDERTAEVLNHLLKELGALDNASADARHLVSGKVQQEDGKPLRNASVSAFHQADGSAIRLGTDTTDSGGRYTITYTAPPGLGSVTLLVRAFSEDGKQLGSSNPIPSAKPLEIVDIVTPATLRPTSTRILEGRIAFENGLPAEGLNLRLYRLDFGGEESQIGEASTRELGLYAFPPFDFEDKPAALQVRVLDAQGVEKPLCKALHDLGDEPRIIVNLVAQTTLKPPLPEYQRLKSALTPQIGDLKKLANAQENSERGDLTILNRATGWDARLIALAANAEKLVAEDEVGLSSEAVYGLLRAGLPSDKLQLAQVSPEAVEQTLTKLKESGIVELSDVPIEAIKEQFKGFADRTRLAVPTPGSKATYGDLLAVSGLDEDAQKKFASVYLKHRGDTTQLWKDAHDAGLDDGQITKLRLQGKLAFLTANSATMTTRLQSALNDPAELVERDYFLASKWEEEVKAAANVSADFNAQQPSEEDKAKLEAVIPSTYAGAQIGDRFRAYTQDMARKVRLAYPTPVLGRLLERDQADEFKLGAGRSSTATLLKNAVAAGFRMGEMPIPTFIKRSPAILNGVADVESASRNLSTLQRLYQITPGDEAVPVLMKHGFTSAYDVLALSEKDFVQFYGPEFISDAYPKLIYRKAQQVSSITYNLFTIAKTLDSGSPVSAISGTSVQRAEAKSKLRDALKDFPTMEGLFGSLDYCECEHCRSVLSPAAYLVDLLQFIDAEPLVWGNFLARWKKTHSDHDYTLKYKKPYDALIERRPDIPYIPLTCENTNTALPYIDVVNEILEYYVANDSLSSAAAHDTGAATTEELLAEPQNVISEAYDKLQQAPYPLALPFDLWIETVREFCDYFGTPLGRLLETFSPGEDLFAPAQPFDRASIFMETLGLSPVEAAVFTNSDPLADWHKLYGYASEAEAKTPAIDANTGQRIDLNSAKALSRRLGVTYKQIVEIVETEFVNPKLTNLTSLYRLGVNVRDVFYYKEHKTFHEQHKDLLGKERADLSAEDQGRFDELSLTDITTQKTGWEVLAEVDGFLQRLEAANRKLAAFGFDVTGWLTTALQENVFDEVLVLADPETGSNFDLTTLCYANGTPADQIVFLRINVFVRLWRKLGWTIEETDRALSAFVPEKARFEKQHLAKQPLKSALIYLAHLKALDAQLKVGKNNRLKLLALWRDLSTTGRKSLYAELFLAQSVFKSGEVEVLTNGQTTRLSIFDNPLGQYLTREGLEKIAEQVKHEAFLANVKDSDKISPAAFAAEPRLSLRYDALGEVQHLSYQGLLTDSEKARLAGLSPSDNLSFLLNAVQAKAKAFPLAKAHLVALQSALGLNADEIALIFTNAGKPMDTVDLSLANVSLLYRYGLFAKALNLTIRDLITLKRLSGLDPFTPLHSEPLADSAPGITPPKKAIDFDYPLTQTLAFVKVAKQIEASGLKIEDVEYLLCHRFDATGKYRSDNGARVALIRTLCEGVNSIRNEHALPADPSAIGEEFLRQKLGLALLPDTVERFLTMVGGTADLTAPAVRDFFDNQLRKQRLRLDGEAGFLDEGDFNTLFGPLKPLLTVAAQDTPEAVDAKLKENEKIERENQGVLQARRHRISQAFLPFLQHRLIRQFIVQTMAANTGAEPVLVERLLTDERLLATPETLLDALAATGERGTEANFFDSTGAHIGEPVLFTGADSGLRDATGKRLAPEGATSAHFEGYFEVPSPGAYRFYIQFEKKDAEAELGIDNLTNPPFLSGVASDNGAEIGGEPDKFVELKPGVPYRFVFHVKKLNAGAVRLLVQGETLSKGPLAQLTLYPPDAFENATNAFTLLSKALQLAQTFNLTEREARFLFNGANPSGFALSKLPSQETSEIDFDIASALFTQLLSLTNYAHLKSGLAGETADLVAIFEADTIEENYDLIAKLARRDKATILVTCKVLFGPNTPAIKNQADLSRLWEALQIVERFGAPADTILAWTRIVVPNAMPGGRFAIAHDLKEAIKARLEPETWQRVAQPIFDKLRQRQRDALVAYVKHQKGFASLEELYEYFLIDPGMEPVVQTSRIRLAISSLQVFVQRCLLNLEKYVHPSALNSKQWEWMKRYRVWEANRKIFLFPENWLEPEFRDDKTHLFAELESNLLQGDVSNDLVEDAFLNYLKRLEELARLDIVAMHVEDTADPANRILHVFGRTFSQPHKYFYRRFAHQMWTPWEPVTAEIEGDHLAPVIWRDRLYLFWVTFLEKAEQPAASSSSLYGKVELIPKHQVMQSAFLESGVSSQGKLSAEKKEKKLVEMTASELTSDVITSGGGLTVEAHLHWSEYLQGQWTMRESSAVNAPSPIVVRGLTYFDKRRIFIHVSKEPFEDGQERGVFIHLGNPINQAFYLAGRNSVPEKGKFRPAPAMPYGASLVNASRYSYSGPLKVEYKRKITTEDGKPPINAVETPGILQQGSSYTLLPCDNEMELGAPSAEALETENPGAVAEAIARGLPEIASLTQPFFYQDNAHTFFIEPNVEERTIEEWEEWITRTPQPEPEWVPPLRLPDFVKPTIPKYKPPMPVDPDDLVWRSPIHHGSLVKPEAGQDWLVNSGTGLLYQGELIGSAGKAEVAIKSMQIAGAAGVEGGVAVNVHAGSALAAGSILVALEGNALDRAGLAQTSAPLNVVGSNGFNSALAQNFLSSLDGSGLSRASRLIER